MRSEQIVLLNGKKQSCRVDEIVLPDIRFQGLFVSRRDQELLTYSYDNAIVIQKAIMKREKGRTHQEEMTVEIPNLFIVAMRKNRAGRSAMPKLLRDEIINFMLLLQAMTKHLLPKVIPVSYTWNNKVAHGFRYHGFAAIADEQDHCG